MNKIIVIDGNNLAYRAHFVNGNLTNGAMYGSFNIIKNIINQFPAYSYCIFWDVGGETRRHTIVKKYIEKGLIKSKYKNRDHSGMEDFYRQLEILRRNVNLIGINSVEKFSVEADDLIGSFVNKFQKEYEIIVVSSDKDFFQLINENVSLYRPVSKEMFDLTTFINAYKIEPRLMLHVGALTGDGSDNIEGVNGIGDKTAIDLIKKYGSLHRLLESDEAKNNKSKKMQAIFQNIEKIKLAYYLKKINRDIDYNFEVQKFNGIKFQELKDFFEKMEFNSFLKNFDQWGALI